MTLTGNPETMQGCERRVSIAVADYVGAIGTAPRSEADIPHFLRVMAARENCDTVLVTGSGASTIGELYRCSAPPP